MIINLNDYIKKTDLEIIKDNFTTTENTANLWKSEIKQYGKIVQFCIDITLVASATPTTEGKYNYKIATFDTKYAPSKDLNLNVFTNKGKNAFVSINTVGEINLTGIEDLSEDGVRAVVTFLIG